MSFQRSPKRSWILQTVGTGALVATIAQLAPAQIGFPGQTSPFPGGGGRSPYPTGGPNGRRNPGGTNPNDPCYDPTYPGNRDPNCQQQPRGGRGPGRDNRNEAPPRVSRGAKPAPITVTTTGILRYAAKDIMVLEADDHRIISYRMDGQSQVMQDGKPVEISKFALGDHLTVDATSDDDGYFTANEVNFNQAGTAADKQAAARTWDLPDLKQALTTGGSGSRGNNGTGSGRSTREAGDERPVIRRAGKSNDSSDSERNDNAKQTKEDPRSVQASAQTAPTTANQAQTPAQTTAQPEADEPERQKTIVTAANSPKDADDPGRPAVRRGRPAARPSSSNSSDSDTEPVATARNTPASRPGQAKDYDEPVLITRNGDNRNADRGGNRPPELAPSSNVNSNAGPDSIAIQEDPVLTRAREAVASYTGSLPNFFCKQLTTRYASDDPKRGWQALDTVSADLAYEDGQESYKNIKVGSRSVNKDMIDIGGSSSTGEFGSILVDLFEPSVQATFRKAGNDTIQNRSAVMFKFEVKRENSHWRVMAPSQLYYPASRGTVWVDKETARVLRIEMESRNIPTGFPFAKVETAIDYDFVRLSGAQSYLLPVDSEVLSCEQGSSRCSRNRIEFRNYRKFGAESDITFTDNN
jgi:hypothetical protein